MIKKLMLLAMAVGALVAFAAPAMASAAVTDTATEEVAPNGTEIGLTGTVGFSGMLGGFKECVLHVVVTTSNGGTTGTAVVTITNHTCVGTGAFTGCTVESATTEHWHVHFNKTDVVVTPKKIDGTNNAACGSAGPFGPGSLENVDLSFGEITLSPTSGTSLDSMSVSGTGVAILENLEGAETAISASGSIGATETGTWELG